MTEPQHKLAYLEVGAEDADYSVIWLHGLGADGHDFEAIVPELHLPAGMAIRFIFPHAPQRPVTINNGYIMRAWYDIADMDIGGVQDENGIRQSAKQIEALIHAEQARGIPYSRIVLAGFSQGGVIALHTGLRFAERLGGIMALSTYLALPDALPDEADPVNQQIPIYMAHGLYDPVIPLQLAERSHQTLQQAGYPLQWYRYAMEHSVHPDEIEDISRWLQQICR